MGYIVLSLGDRKAQYFASTHAACRAWIRWFADECEYLIVEVVAKD